MRSSERSADPLPAPLPEPEGSLIALLMSPLLQIDSGASAKFIHSTPLYIKINTTTFSIQNVYFPFFCVLSLVFYCEKQRKISGNQSLQQQEESDLSLFVLKTVLLNIYCESELPQAFIILHDLFFPHTDSLTRGSQLPFANPSTSPRF